MDPLSLIGLVLAVPMSMLATRISEWQKESHSEEEILAICRKAVCDAAEDLHNPENILGDARPDVRIGEDRRARLTGVLLEVGGIHDFAAMIENPPTGRAREQVESSLVAKMKTALDLPENQADEANATAYDLIRLIAYHLDSAFFEPFLVHQRHERHRGAAIADEVQQRLERPADPYDVDIYLEKLIETVSTDLTHRLALHPLSSDDIHRRLAVETDRERTIDAEQVVDEFARVLMYGEPGSGKSWIAQRVALNAARACQEQRKRGTSLSEMMIPVFTTCSLLERGPDFYSTVTENSSFGPWPDAERARRLLRGDQSLLVVVDSYDESTGSDQLRQHLEGLDRRANTKLLLTSRPTAVPSNISQLFEKTKHTTSRERNDPKATTKVLPMDGQEAAALRASVAEGIGVDIEGLSKWFEAGHLREMAEIPLLSVLSVLAFAEDCDSRPSTVPELYDRAIKRIVRLEAETSRAGKKAWTQTEINDTIDRWMDALTVFAWNTQTVLQPSERFELLDVVPGSEFNKRSNDAGFDGNEERLARSVLTRDDGYRYLHRTIQEHLIARYAAVHFDENVQRHLEFWPPWSAIAPSVILEAPQATIAWWNTALPGSESDLDQERLRLVVRSAQLSSAAFWRKFNDLGNQLADALLLWLERPSDSTLLPAVVRAATIICDRNQLNSLCRALTGWLESDLTSAHIGVACSAITEIGSDDERASLVNFLINLLYGSSNGYPDRALFLDILRELVRIGGNDVSAGLLQWLQSYRRDYRFVAAMRAFVEVSGVQEREYAVRSLTTWLDDFPDADNVYDVATALFELGGDAQEPHAITSLTSWISRNPRSREIGPALRALANMAHDGNRDFIFETLFVWWQQNPRTLHRNQALQFIVGLIGEGQRDSTIRNLVGLLEEDPSVVPVRDLILMLSELVRDEQRVDVASALVHWLGKVEQSNDEAGYMIDGLKNIVGNEQRTDATEAIVAWLNKVDQDTEDICNAMRALTKIVGKDQRSIATEALVSWLSGAGQNSDQVGGVVKTLVEIVDDQQRSNAIEAIVAWLSRVDQDEYYVENEIMALAEIVDDGQRVDAIEALVDWFAELGDGFAHANTNTNTNTSLIGDDQTDTAADTLTSWIKGLDEYHAGVAAFTLARIITPELQATVSRQMTAWLENNLDHHGYVPVASALADVITDPERSALASQLLQWLQDNPDNAFSGAVVKALTKTLSESQRGAAIPQLIRWLKKNPTDQQFVEILQFLVGTTDSEQRDTVRAGLMSLLHEQPTVDWVGYITTSLVNNIVDDRRDQTSAELIGWLVNNPGNFRFGDVHRAIVQIGGEEASRFLRSARWSGLTECLENTAIQLRPARWDQLITELRTQ